jgi:hypothetical protein
VDEAKYLPALTEAILQMDDDLFKGGKFWKLSKPPSKSKI